MRAVLLSVLLGNVSALVLTSRHAKNDMCGMSNPLRITPNALELLQDENPGAGIDKFTPFKAVLKSGFMLTTCVKDYMYYHGDKYGNGKDSYELGSSQVSIVHYDKWVAKEDRQEMTPKVCFNFCRSVPNMGFFGLLNGNRCYCTPYFQQMAGGSSMCDATCEGDATGTCGGKSKSSIYSMHNCPKQPFQAKAIETLSDIPSVEGTSQGKLFYLEAGINIGQIKGKKIDTAKFDYYHSGIGLEFPNGKSFAIEWYATKGLGKALLPGPDLKWDSATQVDVIDGIKKAYWKKRTHVADISGFAWNKYRKSLLAYSKDKSTGYYQTWRVESPKGGKVLLDDVVCDSFSEAAIWKLSKLGAKMLPGVKVKRNYVKLFAQEKPAVVNMKDPKQVAGLVKFWQGVAKLKATTGSSLNPTTIQKEIPRIMAAQKKNKAKPHMYVGSPAIGWHRVALVPPFVRTGYSEMAMPK